MRRSGGGLGRGDGVGFWRGRRGGGRGGVGLGVVRGIDWIGGLIG